MPANNLWLRNLALTDFLTGLIFFLMGFVILLQFFQYYRRSNLKLVNTVWLLAVFGLLYGTSRWLNFFLSVVFYDLPPETYQFWHTTTVVTTAVSFISLYLFGVELLVSTFRRFHYLRFTALIAGGLWILIFLLSFSKGINVWLKEGIAWAYFLLAFPGAILVSLALITQTRDFAKLNIPKLSHAVYGATVSFTLYAVSTGVVYPRWQNFFTIAAATESVFAEPSPALQMFRAACGIGMAYFILNIMRTFNLEGSKKLELANISQAILEERDRISRDLHDGVIQSLYGIGLSLELAYRKTSPDVPEIKQRLQYSLEKLDETTSSVREYIQGLSPLEKHTFSLKEAVSALVRELSQHTNLTIEVKWHTNQEYQLPPHQIDHIYHIIREALYNAAKHAQADCLTLLFHVDKECLTFSVTDNGIGFMERKFNTAQRGLRNIQERVNLLGGSLQFDSTADRGTALTVTIPWEEMQNGKNKAANS